MIVTGDATLMLIESSGIDNDGLKTFRNIPKQQPWQWWRQRQLMSPWQLWHSRNTDGIRTPICSVSKYGGK